MSCIETTCPKCDMHNPVSEQAVLQQIEGSKSLQGKADHIRLVPDKVGGHG